MRSIDPQMSVDDKCHEFSSEEQDEDDEITVPVIPEGKQKGEYEGCGRKE